MSRKACEDVGYIVVVNGLHNPEDFNLNKIEQLSELFNASLDHGIAFFLLIPCLLNDSPK
jgi:hypothetical protein